ncbi:mitochondrial import inner membrane translocase subunit Tim9-like [Adelges cooleyi]|uniref:mitochondrial import inner membrane translocase subunit Tim9-like n=1 Tax=Adelges cooleyi TaxID=133065 RepID=UPI002180964D|nr:mitochondrial import inner membrane translocase subunit Tim9-like [Adelges cooleyi]
MDDEVYIKNIKEFLQNYNKITDECFTQCVYTLAQSKLTDDEVSCANNCVQKATAVDKKCMQAFIEHQQQSVQRYVEEANQKSLVEQENTNILNETESKND